MARRKNSFSGGGNEDKGTARYIKLEKRLVLLAWLNAQFGYGKNRDLLSDIKESAEGFDASGRSYVYHRLDARGAKVRIPRTDLVRYDDNIRDHLQAMNVRRSEPVTLRYFQYLAVLYTELFLDLYFNKRTKFLRLLNHFIDERNASKILNEPNDPYFNESDLNKLAYWMATGSGKTLIMHINYRQFLHYNEKPLDNILLITPNEGLSDQHMEEMTASGIPCRRFELNETGLSSSYRNDVRVIEITKLVEDKKGGGLSVPVEAFEGNNLIFVDEGHKGSSSTKNQKGWRYLRSRLDVTGFTFEYSATFGQALTAAKNDELTAEYGKNIIFDYSYRYFHGDGYGKDFRVLNLREQTTDDITETLMMGNLLSFYQQKRLFRTREEELRPYNLEKPLWVFVGGTVNAVYTRNKKKRSDVLDVVRFFHHVLENRRNWSVRTIKKLTEGKTKLVSPYGQDVFEGKFDYINDLGLKAGDIYRNILAEIFQTPSGGGLHLCDIRGAEGEIGLKAASGEDYFGVIYIGDTREFRKLADKDDAGMTIEEDAISDSLFDGINDPETGIDVLIGAKKFMEGWNSWRVSNMGLLNIGRSEGSQIIQLFGRGVRLRGKGFTLKRSEALDGKHPERLNLLETLNIFSVRADYMSQFSNYLEREGIETEGYTDLPLFVKPNRNFLKKGLVVPRLPEDRNFAREVSIMLEPDPDITVRVDMSLKVQSLESAREGLLRMDMNRGEEKPIPSGNLGLIDWEKLYFDLLEYKERKGMTNLAVKPDAPKKILSRTEPNRLYRLIADETVVSPESFQDVSLLQDAATNIMRKYVDAFYRRKREHWDCKNMIYKRLDDDDPNLRLNGASAEEEASGQYTVKVKRSEKELTAQIVKLIKNVEQLYDRESKELPRIHFDRHLYQPLLVEYGDKMKMSPPGLNESEKKFVTDLKDYWLKERNKSLADVELFLLRNLSKGSGIGFFEGRYFYPDFILWIKKGKRQHIVFVEPHGMVHADAQDKDNKVQLHKELPALAKRMSERSGIRNVILDSYIISATPFQDLRKKYEGNWNRQKFSDAHILFFERDEEYDYIEKLLNEQISRDS